MKKIVFVPLIICSIIIHSSGQVFESNHFTIQKLADGVYAAIAKNGAHAICNAGIIDLGDATLVFDPFMTPAAAEDLKKAAQILTSHPVKYIVNSHFHNDHIGGNQVFENATIISTSQTRELIAKYQPEEIAADKVSAPARLQQLKNKNTAGMTPHELDENIMWTGYYEALVTSNDSLKTILPAVTFTDQLLLQGTKLKLLLLSYGKGHTESDLFLYLPVQQIAFLGDLLFIQNQPWLGDGDPDQWKTYLDSISQLRIRTVVPGHGPLGNLTSLDSMKLYFETVKNTAIEYHKKGELPENDITLKSPPPYNLWFLSNFYKPNVISTYNQLYKK